MRNSTCVVASADEQKRAQVETLAAQFQEATSDSVEIAFFDQGYMGDQAAADAEMHGIRLTGSGVLKSWLAQARVR